MIRLSLIALLAVPHVLSAKVDVEQDKQTLSHIKEALWPEAYRTQNVEALDRLLHDSFELVTASGERRSKDDELKDLPRFPWPHERFVFTIKRLDVYANGSAVVSGEGKAAGTNSSGTYCSTYQSSNVLVKQEQSWKAILSHVSGVSQGCPGEE